jgi:hypothetical protein
VICETQIAETNAMQYRLCGDETYIFLVVQGPKYPQHIAVNHMITLLPAVFALHHRRAVIRTKNPDAKGKATCRHDNIPVEKNDYMMLYAPLFFFLSKMFSS